jgi:polysaccharide pyruvyl transferase WcaK-like protein
VVSVRKTAHFAAGVEHLAAAVDRLTELGAQVAFVPFGGPEDAEASTVVMRRCRSNPVLVPVDGWDDAAEIFARASVAIGVRLHAIVLAVCLGVPFAAVPYDPKVANLCEDIAYPLAPLWVPRRGSETRAAASLVDELWSRRAELAERLRGDAVRMRALAERNFTVLDRIVFAARA